MAIRSNSAKPAPTPNTTTEAVTSKRRSKHVVRRSLAKRLLAVGCLGFAAIGLTGCTATDRMVRDLHEHIDESMVEYTNRAMAEKAWFRHKHLYCDVNNIREFKDGFIQGYLDIASGGSGCTPMIIPREYWGWKYQSAHGQSAVNAWFQGFPLGVKAAEEDGIGYWQQIPTMGLPTAVPPIAQPVYGNGAVDPFVPGEEMIPLPEVMEEGLQLEPGMIDEIELPTPPLRDATLSDYPIIESPSDDSDYVSRSNVSSEEALSATFNGVTLDAADASLRNGPTSTEPTAPAETDSSELPFSFE